MQMNLPSLFVPQRISLAIILFSLLFSVSLFAAPYTEEISTQEYLFAKGMLRDVSPAMHSITIQQNNGPRLTVLVNAETEFKGFKKLEDLQSSQNVKIWYRQDQSGNIGLKILRPPELGC
jgi:hypothetical protein